MLIFKSIFSTQNRKPKFDAVHFEESVKPYAEDVTTANQYEKYESSKHMIEVYKSVLFRLSNMILPLANHSYGEQIKVEFKTFDFRIHIFRIYR